MSNGICVAEGAGTEILTGTSLKAALDLDWDDPQAQCGTVYNIANVELSWVFKQKTDLDDKTTKHVNKSIEDARQIEAQDVEEAVDGSQSSVKVLPRIDAFQSRDMRHGRKSRSQNLTVTNVTFLRT